jgi:uncharacterized protein
MRTPRTAVLSPAAPLRLAHALAWLLLSLFLSVASAQELVAVPPLQARVTDLTGTLAADRVAALDAQLRAFEQRKGVQIAVLMVRSTRPEPVEQYALRVVEQWKLGRRKVDDGALLLVAKDDRTLRIEVGYGIEGALSDVVSRRIIDEVITPRFRQGDFDGGIAAGAEQIMRGDRWRGPACGGPTAPGADQRHRAGLALPVRRGPDAGRSAAQRPRPPSRLPGHGWRAGCRCVAVGGHLRGGRGGWTGGIPRHAAGHRHGWPRRPARAPPGRRLAGRRIGRWWRWIPRRRRRLRWRRRVRTVVR